MEGRCGSGDARSREDSAISLRHISLKKSLVVALDLPDFSSVRKTVGLLSSSVSFYKVGLRLFTREGPKVVSWLKQKGFQVFLDLKFHDIPNTVAEAVESATQLGVDLISVHALGGAEMMQAAVKSARLSSRKFRCSRPKIFAVTILTSHSEVRSLGIPSDLSSQVKRLAMLAKKSNVDGIICSPQEIRMIRKTVGKKLKILTPGIRPQGSELGDQKRVATPEQALSDGADYLVMGRPILQSKNPIELIRRCFS